MISYEQWVPTTPTPIPSEISVLEMDNERRIRREQLKQMDDDHHDASQLSSSTAGGRTKKRSASCQLPLLLEVDEIPTKKRFLVTPNVDDLAVRQLRPRFLDHRCDGTTSQASSSSRDQEEEALLLQEMLEENDNDQQEQELVALSKNTSRSKWDEPISMGDFRPRRLRFRVLNHVASATTSLKCRRSHASDFLPYMPL